METSEKILTGISDQEKGAYLSAIASIATADLQASELEIEHLSHLCEAADLSAQQQEHVLNVAKGTSDADLVRSLDILKSSELKYSLVTDLLAFAKSDNNYSEAEQHSVQKIANYLGVDQKQFGLLDKLAEKTNASTSAPSDEPGFLSAFGLGDKLKQSGINSSSLLKGLVSIAAPMILSRMMRRNQSYSTNSMGGLGGLLGGATMGGGGLLGGGGGGLGSLIGMLSGGRGMGSAGGLLGRIFR